MSASRRGIDLMVGGFVLLGLGALLFLALKAANLGHFSSGPTYEVQARFDNIGGLKPRAPVKSAGVVVGRVVSISFDGSSRWVSISRGGYFLPISVSSGPRVSPFPATRWHPRHDEAPSRKNSCRPRSTSADIVRIPSMLTLVPSRFCRSDTGRNRSNKSRTSACGCSAVALSTACRVTGLS